MAKVFTSREILFPSGWTYRDTEKDDFQLVFKKLNPAFRMLTDLMFWLGMMSVALFCWFNIRDHDRIWWTVILGAALMIGSYVLGVVIGTAEYKKATKIYVISNPEDRTKLLLAMEPRFSVEEFKGLLNKLEEIFAERVAISAPTPAVVFMSELVDEIRVNIPADATSEQRRYVNDETLDVLNDYDYHTLEPTENLSNAAERPQETI